jgi:L-threonylcarbamoyladenylate synthase
MANLSLNNAYKLLNNKQIISLPTDTVAGLVADACADIALKKIYQIKNRSINKPLSILVADINMAAQYVYLNNLAKKLLCLDFSVTIVAMAKLPNNLSRYVNLKNQFIALRIPKDEFLINLLRMLERPLIATSVNISGAKNSDNLLKNNMSRYIKKYENINNPSAIIDIKRKIIIRSDNIHDAEITKILHDY